MKIELIDIKKTYNRQIIFQGLNWEIKSGMRYGISGHNGSGKSTLLKIIAGYISPNLGNIQYSLNDKAIDSDKIYSFVSYAAPYLDIPNDFNFFELLNFHFSNKERFNQLTNEQINEIFHLPLQIPIRQYSSGMIQRVKLALAFFSKSELLLLDEPTETLDEQGFLLFELLLSNYTQDRTTIIASNKPRDFINCDSVKNIIDYKH